MANKSNVENAIWSFTSHPLSYDVLCFHSKIYQNFDKIIATNDFPHIILYGPAGSGKKSIIEYLIHRLFKENTIKSQITMLSYQGKDAATHKFQIAKGCSYAIIDAFCNKNLLQSVKKVIKKFIMKTTPLFVIIIHNFDLASKRDQMGLRRLIECSNSNTRFMMTSESLTKICYPIRSRCAAIRVPAPTLSEIKSAMEKISFMNEEFPNKDMICSIIKITRRNLNSGLNLLQYAIIKQLKPKEELKYPIEIINICNIFKKTCTPTIKKWYGSN